MGPLRYSSLLAPSSLYGLGREIPRTGAAVDRWQGLSLRARVCGGIRALKRECDGATPLARDARPLRLLAPTIRNVDRFLGFPSRRFTADDGWCDAPGVMPNYNRHVRIPYPASHEHIASVRIVSYDHVMFWIEYLGVAGAWGAARSSCTCQSPWPPGRPKAGICGRARDDAQIPAAFCRIRMVDSRAPFEAFSAGHTAIDLRPCCSADAEQWRRPIRVRYQQSFLGSGGLRRRRGNEAQCLQLEAGDDAGQMPAGIWGDAGHGPAMKK